MQLGEYGSRLSFTTGLDMTTTTDIRLRIMPQGQSSYDRVLTAGDITDKKMGVVSYLLQQGDLPVWGVYQIQAFDVTTGRFLPSTIGTFEVERNLPDPG